jgi:DNA modification methylase
VTLYVQDSDFTLYVGDVRDCLRELPDASVHCVVTSPPYWGLRDYGTGAWDGGNTDCDHAIPLATTRGGPKSTLTSVGARDGANLNTTQTHQQQFRDVCGKCGATRVDQQLGLEATPDLFVARMVEVFREVRRVLRLDGTCWVNLGDSYNANQGAGFNAHRDTRPHLSGEGVGQKRIDEANRNTVIPSGLPSKNLMGMPWRVAFALQADGWYLRSDIIWSKPNPMPESVTDRPTKAHEYVFLLTRSPRYFFDADAVREDGAGRLDLGRMKRPEARMGEGGRWANDNGYRTEAGRNIRSVWEIATQPYPEAHFATFPEALPERCIRAGTSERGCCPECGAPWERVTLVSYEPTTRTPAPNKGHIGAFQERAANMTRDGFIPNREKQTETTGWNPTCNCAESAIRALGPSAFREPVPCTVLDPFMGSGTTALVARRLGRRSIGVELNESYAALCARRLQQLSLFAGATDG